jgi:hypothetical protein
MQTHQRFSQRLTIAGSLIAAAAVLTGTSSCQR